MENLVSRYAFTKYEFTKYEVKKRIDYYYIFFYLYLVSMQTYSSKTHCLFMYGHCFLFLLPIYSYLKIGDNER